MTFNKFKKDFLNFLEASNVNLGRKTAKTRLYFISEAKRKFNAFVCDDNDGQVTDNEVEKEPRKDMSDRVLRIEPKDKRRGLDAGKGCHAMTASESQRADEQLGHSPYAGKEGQTDE